MSLLEQNRNNLIQQLDRYTLSEIEERDLWMSLRDAIQDNGIGDSGETFRKIKEIRKVETLLETKDVTGIVYPNKRYAELFWDSITGSDLYRVLRTNSDTEPLEISDYDAVEDTDRLKYVDFKIKTKERYWYKVSAYTVETTIVYEDSVEVTIDKPYDAIEY